MTSSPASGWRVTIPLAARRRRAGIAIRRRNLHPEDVTTVEGLPVTAWPLTILDLAAVESPKRLALGLDRTVTLQLFDLHAMNSVLVRHPRAHGAPALRAAVAQMTGESERTRSGAEVDVRWLLLTSELPRPLVNAPVLAYVADLYWPTQRLIVEVDSSRWHDGPFARRDDHHRQAHPRSRRLRPATRTQDRPAAADAATHPRRPGGKIGRSPGLRPGDRPIAAGGAQLRASADVRAGMRSRALLVALADLLAAPATAGAATTASGSEGCTATGTREEVECFARVTATGEAGPSEVTAVLDGLTVTVRDTFGVAVGEGASRSRPRAAPRHDARSRARGLR